MANIIAVARGVSGVDQTTPFEGGASGSGGTIGYSSPIPMPTVTKTTTAALILPRFGGKVAPGSTTTNFSPSAPSGYTATMSGPFASPNAGNAVVGSVFESGTISAAGTYSGLSGGTTPAAGPGRQIQSYATRISCLRPAVAGVSPVPRSSAQVNTSGSSFSFTLSSSAQSNLIQYVDVHIDDPAATVTPPAGWTQTYRQTHTNGVLVGYWTPDDPGSLQSFTVSTSSVPTVNSAAVVSAAHSPAHVGDTINVDTNTSYTAPGGDPITLYERRPQILDSITGWGDVSGVAYTASAQSGLDTWTITSAADGKSGRYASRAQNGAGWSDWSYSNALTVLDAPVIASTPAIVTDGTPQDGETVTVDVSSGARSTRYTGNGIDSYETKWQDNTSGSYADLSGTSDTSALLLTSGQVGHQVRFAERAHNASGYTSWNYSSAITVAAHPAISAADVLFRLSGGSGNDEGALSIGGELGDIYYEYGDDPADVLDALFGAVLGSVASAGGTFYRCVYIVNTHTIDSLLNLKAFVETQYDHPGLQLAVGVPTEAANTPVTAVASGTTAPASVTFTTATTAAGGQTFGSLTPGSYRGLWLRLTVTADTDQLEAPGDFATFAVEET